MKQEFTWHAFENAEMPSRSTRLINIVAEYFAYVGVIGVAVCIAVMTLAFSAAVGIQVLDEGREAGILRDRGAAERARHEGARGPALQAR